MRRRTRPPHPAPLKEVEDRQQDYGPDERYALDTGDRELLHAPANTE